MNLPKWKYDKLENIANIKKDTKSMISAKICKFITEVKRLGGCFKVMKPDVYGLTICGKDGNVYQCSRTMSEYEYLCFDNAQMICVYQSVASPEFTDNYQGHYFDFIVTANNESKGSHAVEFGI